MDPCQYLLRTSPDVLNKKTKVLDFKTDKKCFIKINIELRPQEIWILDKDPFSWEKKSDPHHWLLAYEISSITQSNIPIQNRLRFAMVNSIYIHLGLKICINLFHQTKSIPFIFNDSFFIYKIKFLTSTIKTFKKVAQVV